MIEIQMFIGQELIDSLPVNAHQMNHAGYIHSLKAKLEEKNEDIIDLSGDEPVFFIDAIPSRFNTSVPGKKN
jgi:hypothetical protein